MSKFPDDIIQKELVCENDNFEIPEKYKNMSIEELKIQKEKLYNRIKNERGITNENTIY